MAKFLYSLIGLEMHIALRSKTKLFSPATCTQLKAETDPNTQVCPLDIGAPGALPLSINEECVRKAVRLARMLNCHLNTVSLFDRKHYDYIDLPIGYQITQKRKPIAEQGYFDYPALNPKCNSNYTTNRAFVKHVQLEQDTATNQIYDENSEFRKVDYNRSGLGLVELVTDCSFSSGEQVKLFVDEMRLALRLAEISRLENTRECPVRVDVNVSTHFKTPSFTREPGPLAEFKNLSRSAHIELSVDSEIFRQSALIMNGHFERSQRIETRSYNQTTKINSRVRFKEDSDEYMFMPEPNVPPLVLCDSFLKQCSTEIKTPMELRKELVSDGIAADMIQADSIVRNNVHREFFALARAGIPVKLAKSILKRDYVQFRKKYPEEATRVIESFVVDVVRDIHLEKMKRNWFEKAMLEKIDGTPIPLH